MQNLKDLMEKYTVEGALDTDVEVDMDPTVGVIEVITNEDQEHQLKEAIESAVTDAESYDSVAKDAEELEANLDKEKEEEATTESALRIIGHVDAFLSKHNYVTADEKAAMGFDVATLNTESAQSYPTLTKENAEAAGETVLEKVKKALKAILDKIIAAFNKVKDVLLSMLGNNAATARKLLGLMAGLEDKVAEGKTFNGDFREKFPMVKTFDKNSIIASMNNNANSSVLGEVVKAFVSGVGSKNLDKFNKLDGFTGSKDLASELGVSKAIFVNQIGEKVQALVSENDTVELVSRSVTAKGAKMSAPLSLSDLKAILTEVITRADSAKKEIEATKAAFESLKTLKIEDKEFVKSAHIESKVSMLTRAKMAHIDHMSKQPKVVLQFVAANLAVKAKKA